MLSSSSLANYSRVGILRHSSKPADPETEPNPDDAVEAKIADLYRQDRSAYEKEARDWTKRYATGTANKK